MSLKETIQAFLDIAESQPSINSQDTGSVYEILNANPVQKYGAFVLTQGQHRWYDDRDEYYFYLFYAGRNKDDNSNVVENQSTAHRVLKNIIKTFVETYDAEVVDLAFNAFNERFTDMCSGMYATLRIAIPESYTCEEVY